MNPLSITIVIDTDTATNATAITAVATGGTPPRFLADATHVVTDRAHTSGDVVSVLRHVLDAAAQAPAPPALAWRRVMPGWYRADTAPDSRRAYNIIYNMDTRRWVTLTPGATEPDMPAHERLRDAQAAAQAHHTSSLTP